MLQKRVVILSLNISAMVDVLQERSTFSFLIPFQGTGKEKLSPNTKVPRLHWVKATEPRVNTPFWWTEMNQTNFLFCDYKRYVISTVTSILSTRPFFHKLLRANATLLKLILRKKSHLTNVRLSFAYHQQRSSVRREVGSTAYFFIRMVMDETTSLIQIEMHVVHWSRHFTYC